jgi:hypothetical protein
MCSREKVLALFAERKNLVVHATGVEESLAMARQVPPMLSYANLSTHTYELSGSHATTRAALSHERGRVDEY